MNLLEYIKQGGKCKSSAGHWFILSKIGTGEYPIEGTLEINGKQYPYKWTETGIPHNLPYTHGLGLVPVIKVTSYRIVDKDLLKRYLTREEFERSIQRIFDKLDHIEMKIQK